MRPLVDDPPLELAPADRAGAQRKAALSAWIFPFLWFGVLGVVALVIGAVVAIDRGGATSATATTAEPTMVTLTEFAITPASITATLSGGLHVMNEGTVAHNLSVEGTDVRTPDINAKSATKLDLSSLKAGDYTVVCLIPGHKDAGMTAALHVTETGSAAVAASGSDMSGMTSSSSMSQDEMDRAMKASMAPFPAATKGLGAQVLAPTVLPDGTKQFELTAEATDWEVSPGKFVKAKTYNGTVPGPTLKVDPGDKVRIVLHNRLDESTSIHFHGITTPNAMDGTTFVTQDPVLPGADFVYEWTAQSTPAVGMYHSHHVAFQQVPDGLAGAFLIGQEPLPAGVTVAQQHVMVLDDSGVIGFALNGKSFPATEPYVASQGEWIEVQYMNEGTAIHPMHLHGMGQLVIAKDGFPLVNPQEEDTVTVAPGERYTVLVHATEPGTWVWHCHILPHAENDNGMFGMVTALIVK